MLDKLEIPQINPLDRDIWDRIQKRFDNLIKPVGSLARLEDITCLYATAQKTESICLPKKTLIVFASDHGLAVQGLSGDTTEDSFASFVRLAKGDSGTNVMASFFGAQVELAEIGLQKPVSAEYMKYSAHVTAATANILQTVAMSEEQFASAFKAGKDTAAKAVAAGAQVLGMGCLGAGAEFSQLALLAGFVGKAAADLLPGAELSNKRLLVEEILQKHVGNGQESALVLTKKLGGLEIPAMAGAMLQSAQLGVPVFLDGVATLLAAYLAIAINPAVKDFLVPVCTTSEPGQGELLTVLGWSTMLDLKISASCGSGSLLGFSLLDAGIKALNEMDAFGEETVHSPLGDIK